LDAAATIQKMRSLLLLAFAAVGTATSSILQPLPKHFKQGNAKVVFVKDRLTTLPKTFKHTKEGIPSSPIEERP
jgi:hypothetical protein